MDELHRIAVEKDIDVEIEYDDYWALAEKTYPQSGHLVNALKFWKLRKKDFALDPFLYENCLQGYKNRKEEERIEEEEARKRFEEKWDKIESLMDK